MNAKVEQGTSPLDMLKWALVVAIIAVGVWGNTYYAQEYSPLYRALALIVLAALALGIAYLTEKGRAFVELLKEARVEAKKVVWPTRAETHQSTLIVAVVVAAMSLILWGLDSFLAFIVKLLLG
jgi:preprotein translocase subunit SecE